MTNEKKKHKAWADWTPEQRAERAARIKAAWAARTPEAEAERLAKRRATKLAKTDAEKEQARINHKIAVSTRSAEAVAASNAKRAATRAARTPDERAAIIAKGLASHAARSPEAVAESRARQVATAAARTPEQKAAQLAKTLAARAAWTPEQRAEYKAKFKAKRAARKRAEVQAELDKARQTLLANHGVASPLRSPAIRESMRATVRERYGVDNTFQSPELAEKGRQTMLQTYGVEYAMQSAELLEKSRATMLSLYGVDNAGKSPELAEKGRQTMLESYGTTCPWKISKAQGTCSEDQVRKFLNDLGFNFREAGLPGSRQALDGLDETAKVAFEFHGLFWHCEDSRTPRLRDFHRGKMLACRANGIRLFSIFEDEWARRQEQVKGFLRAALGKNTTRIPGRKVAVRCISDVDAQTFYDAYHIQGATTRGHASAGLFLDGDLLGAMTFGRHHRGGDQTVLTRLCFKSDVTVIGGSAKLFKFLVAESGAREVISWSDNRWSEGGVYKALGFFSDEELPPDYAYVSMARPVERISKQSQRKSATGCPADKTEHEWARERGLSRIWDCGKIRWKWVAA